MSSSKGIGASARDMADLLPPELLRFLMIRTKPNSPVNFDVHEEGIVKLFNEYDRFHDRYYRGTATHDEQTIYELVRLEAAKGNPCAVMNFQWLSALIQMPHLDPIKESLRRLGRTSIEMLGDIERKQLEQRIGSAREWVKRYATEEEKTHLQETLPARSEALTHPQRAFLNTLAEALEKTAWDDDSLQTAIFDVARTTPIEQGQAFKAIYRVLLDREAGPKAGNLLAFLDRSFVVKRFRELTFEKVEFWKQSAMTAMELRAWFEKEKAKVIAQEQRLQVDGAVFSSEYLFTLADGKRFLKRVVTEGAAAPNGLLA